MTDIRMLSFGHINLRGNSGDAQFVEGVSEVLEQALPLQPNTVSLSSHRVYWLGPDEWQVVTDLDQAATLAGRLEQRLAGQRVAVNDISGGQVVFQLPGADVPALLARGCTLDLSVQAFAVGACAQSGLAKANVLLGCIDEAPVYEIIVRRSFSEYLELWLRKNTHTHAGSASC